MNTAALMEISRRWASRSDAPTAEDVAQVETELEQLPALPRAIREALMGAQVMPRAGESADKPRLLVLVAGLPVDLDDPETSLGKRFAELKTPSQREAAATFLKEVLRQRRRARRRSTGFVHNW
ncbi:hypothetical protein [Variovorax sp. 350MFTsu5.1]|uniref:hypothetical protein n=1 Tax=Variovorax sp. 350MFTsu5.1 TaxID=3158365 RepID=UPI003AAB94F7